MPQPCMDCTARRLARDLREAGIEVLDLNGRLVLTQRTNLNSGRNLERIDTEGLVAGMYLLRITNDRESISQRFVRGR